MTAQTTLPAVHRRASQAGAQSRLAALAASGFLGVGVPARLGGHGGRLADLFRDPAARHWLQGLQHADLLLLHSQRLVIEALVNTDNIGLRELQLPDLLAGTLAGASALESAVPDAQTMGLGWRFHGPLRGVPNLQWDGFSLLLPVQTGGQVEGLLLVRSEENGLTVHRGEAPALWELAACADVHLHETFLRADEWLGDRPLWDALVDANQLMRDGLRQLHRR